jgi:D-sedoheptulose 7-phosphate isomerase
MGCAYAQKQNTPKEEKSVKALDDLQAHYPELERTMESVHDACDMIVSTYMNGGKVLTCGNGGSAADAEHIVGELLKSFELKRPLSDQIASQIRESCPDEAQLFIDQLQMPLSALSLTSHLAFSTAFANDEEPSLVFAQALLGLAKAGDVLVALSTSGTSENVVLAVKLARALGVRTIGLTGKNGGSLPGICDICICAPAERTYRVQEYHVAIYHAICRAIEDGFFGHQDDEG